MFYLTFNLAGDYLKKNLITNRYILVGLRIRHRRGTASNRFPTMNRVSLLIGMGLVLSLALGTGCLGDAPHDNPFDPNSDRFVREGDITGRVTDRADAPLPDAEVRLISGSAGTQPELLVRTDSRGDYAFSDVMEGSGYRILVRRDGYVDGMLEALDIQAGVEKELPTLRLNALPLITDAAFRTIHISRWWPTNDLFFLEVNATVADADGLLDIEEVWFEIPAQGYRATLDPQGLSGGLFDKQIRADSLPIPNLQSLLGQTLRLSVRDREGSVVTSDAGQLVRVVENTPNTVDPFGDELLDTNRPTLTWEPFPPLFDFTYRIDVFRIETNPPVLVRQINDIPMDQTALRLGSTLPTGSYFWTVTVIDDFGNQSRSKQAGFLIP